MVTRPTSWIGLSRWRQFSQEAARLVSVDRPLVSLDVTQEEEQQWTDIKSAEEFAEESAEEEEDVPGEIAADTLLASVAPSPVAKKTPATISWSHTLASKGKGFPAKAHENLWTAASPESSTDYEVGVSKWVVARIAAAAEVPKLSLAIYGIAKQPLQPEEWATAAWKVIQSAYRKAQEVGRHVHVYWIHDDRTQGAHKAWALQRLAAAAASPRRYTATAPDLGDRSAQIPVMGDLQPETEWTFTQESLA